MRGWRSEGLHGEEELERWVWAAASFLLTVLGSNPSLDDRPWTQVGRGDRAAHLAGGSEGGFPALTSAGVGASIKASTLSLIFFVSIPYP